MAYGNGRKRRWLPREAYLARRAQQNQEALDRARDGISPRNEAIVIEAFRNRGIPERDVRPRENCLTVPAWNAVGRRVMKGQKGVRINTLRPSRDEDGNETGEKIWTVSHVFHVTQTEASVR